MIDKFTQKGSLVDLMLHGSIFAYVILIVLLLMSLISWALSFYKFYYYGKTLGDSAKFLSIFHQSGKITESNSFIEQFPMAFTVQMFHASHREFIKIYSQFKSQQIKETNEADEEEGGQKIIATPTATIKEEMIKRLERNIEKTIVHQNNEQEKGLATLAVISSTSPYLGLLGTVIGIIRAFMNIGTQGATSLAAVAPGIAEALVTTAFGLFTAIPALIFYNLFRSKMRKIETEQYAFGLELINIFEKAF